MSFTCTRHQDSIPCHTSPDYFYLNKRNGDPKAFFLTEEDIKPNSNGGGGSGNSNSLQSLYSNSNLPDSFPSTQSLSTSNRAAVSTPTTNAAISLRPTSSSSNAYSSSPSIISTNHRPNGVISMLSSKSGLEQPESSYGLQPSNGRLSSENYNNGNEGSGSPIRIIRGGDSGNGGGSSSYSKLVDPYDISSKYSNIKPGVKYSMKAIKSKYEPSSTSSSSPKKVSNFFDLPSPQQKQTSSGYIEDLHRTGNSYSGSGKYQTETPYYQQTSKSNSAESKYRPLNGYMGYQPGTTSSNNNNNNNGPSMIDQLLAKYGASKSEVSTAAATTTSSNKAVTDDYLIGYHRATAIESPPHKSNQHYSKRTPTPTPTLASTSAFTPASFSKMYMENVQKAAKYIGAPVSTNEIHGKTELSSQFYHSYPPKSTSSNLLVDRQSKSYTAVPFPASGSRAKSSSKYDSMSSHYPTSSSSSSPHQLINSNQYVVPSSIRIIEPADSHRGGGNNGKASSHSTSQHLTPLSSIDSGSQEQLNSEMPVKMSFVSKGDGDSSMADFGNLRVVKQVKGKNLLIDPSLENDPARDNIIAQVLEMLNKYN